MKRILIVEDDQIVANIYRNKFTVEGYQVETAHDGQAGLDTLQTFKPDAMILDLMLPKLSGVEVMKKVRAQPEFEKLPIIVFSNTYLTNLVQEAWKAGATKCLSKANCSPKQLLELVRSTLAAKNGNGSTPANEPAATHPTAAAAAEAPAQPASVEDSDAQFQAGLRKTFIEGLPTALNALRGSLQTLIKAGDQPTRVAQMQEMFRRIHGLTSSAGLTGMACLGQVADGLEALLKELQEKPANINASTLRTVALAIDFLGTLSEPNLAAEPPGMPSLKILVVDDEAISRRAVTYALEKARLKSVSLDDPQAALNLLMQTRFDLIFLDVDMPGMNGYELCAKLRELPAHKKTPVVFVTGLNDFENRANSMMSGGTDFIAKPFLFIELAVKALVYVLRSRLGVAK